MKPIEGAGEEGVGKRVYVCGFCKKIGHNVRTCPSKGVSDYSDS